MGTAIIPRFGVVIFLLSYLGIARAQTDAESILAKINGMAPASRTEVLVTEARKEALVQWNSTMPVTDARDVIDRFRKKYPFIDVQYSRMSGTAVVNRLLTEYKAGTSRLDVLGARGDMHPTLMKAGVVAKNDAPFRAELRAGFIDKEGLLQRQFHLRVGHWLQHAQRTCPERSNVLSKSISARMEWPDRLRSRVLRMVGRDDRHNGRRESLGFLARRLAAQNLRTVRGHTLLTQLVAAGEIQALLDGYHHQMITFKEKGAPVDFAIPETMIIKEPSGIWITKKAPHPHAAALFVDFLFSKAGQEIYQNGNRLVARRDLEWNFGGKKVNRTHVIDMHKWGQKYDHLIRSFDQIFRKSR